MFRLQQLAYLMRFVKNLVCFLFERGLIDSIDLRMSQEQQFEQPRSFAPLFDDNSGPSGAVRIQPYSLGSAQAHRANLEEIRATSGGAGSGPQRGASRIQQAASSHHNLQHHSPPHQTSDRPVHSSPLNRNVQQQDVDMIERRMLEDQARLMHLHQQELIRNQQQGVGDDVFQREYEAIIAQRRQQQGASRQTDEFDF